ncbi:hypothetical protein GCM10022226_17900 [Sphaerisporangium flaviroseum]|uniref:Uncharacterized protein n=1 Tax=Sphaerisporangium flaviroseum TaxID=509199 RepID=A0ABP7HLP4_9ACTN
MTESPPLPTSAPHPIGVASPARAPRERSAARRTLRRLLAPGWPPATAATAFTVAVLVLHGVSLGDITVFGAYVVLGLVLPGMLIVRALHGGARTLAEELALGLTLGYTVEVIVYIAARAMGLPLLVLAWPIATYAVFAAVPRLRRHWREARRPGDVPLWWSWSLALIFAYLVIWSAVNFFRTHALTWPGLGAAYIDLPYHLALIGELKHHMPPTVPVVAGEPLLYHWFVYAHLAAASWVTGLEPLLLLFRLAMVPMLAAIVVLLAMVGRRIVRSWPGALLCVVGTVFMAAPNLYLGPNVGVFGWRGVQSWGSPTQTFGTLLFAPLIICLLDLLEHRRTTAGQWVLTGTFLVAIMGAKASYLPLLIAGLLAVTAAGAIRDGRPHRPALIVLGMAATCFLFAQIVLFGGARQGTMIEPLDLMHRTWTELTGQGHHLEAPPASLAGVTVLYLLCWAVTWCGVLGFLSRPESLLRPEAALLLGLGTAGVGAVLVLKHPHLSELYFLGACYPYLTVAAVYGLTLIVRRAELSRGAIACAAGAGVVSAYLVHTLCGVQTPLSPGRSDTILYLPYAALLAVVLLAAAVLKVTARGVRAWALVLCMTAAIGLPASWCTRVLSIVFAQPSSGVLSGSPAATPPAVPQGLLTAGRWLRAHSRPGDLVATNAHCLWSFHNPCDSRHFWVSALSERRVLLEGWTYTAANMDRWRPGLPPENLPFWDQERLRANDEAFTSPSAASIQRLRDRYGVRWLFVDERHAVPSTAIGDFATFQMRSGDYAVYRLTALPARAGAT